MRALARKLGVSVLVLAALFGAACTKNGDAQITPQQAYERVYHHYREKGASDVQARLLAQAAQDVVADRELSPQEKEFADQVLKELQTDAHRVEKERGAGVVEDTEKGYEW